MWCRLNFLWKAVITGFSVCFLFSAGSRLLRTADATVFFKEPKKKKKEEEEKRFLSIPQHNTLMSQCCPQSAEALLHHVYWDTRDTYLMWWWNVKGKFQKWDRKPAGLSVKSHPPTSDHERRFVFVLPASKTCRFVNETKWRVQLTFLFKGCRGEKSNINVHLLKKICWGVVSVNRRTVLKWDTHQGCLSSSTGLIDSCSG